MAEKKKGNQKTANSLNVRYKYSENLSEKQAIYNNLFPVGQHLNSILGGIKP